MRTFGNQEGSILDKMIGQALAWPLWPQGHGVRQLLGRGTCGHRPQSVGEWPAARTDSPLPRTKVGQGYSAENGSPGRAEEQRVSDWNEGMGFGQMPPVIFMSEIPMGTGVEVSEMR